MTCNEVSTTLTRNNGQTLMFLMLCNRTRDLGEDTSRVDVANALTQQRLQAFAEQPAGTAARRRKHHRAMTAPIALSCGDPAGIGPEIAAKAWADLRDTCPFFYIGDAIPPARGHTGPVDRITDPCRSLFKSAQTALPVLQLDFPAPNTPGQPDPANAPSASSTPSNAAFPLVQSGAASALCTAPIHKKALIDGARFAYPGHTEFLAALAGRQRVVMMLASAQLRVVPATIHIPLSRVPSGADPGPAARHDRRSPPPACARQFGIAHPRASPWRA